MSGILDGKQRVLDVIMTHAGKAQMASGHLRVQYVSFSDAESYYEADVVSGSTDVTSRVMFEACDLPQDDVTFEADDSGLLRPFKNSTQYDVVNGQVVSWSTQAMTGSVLTGSVLTNYVTGSAFASLSDSLLESSIDNFKNLRILGSYDLVFDDQDFVLSTNTVSWTINDRAPIDLTTGQLPTKDVNVIDSLITDPRCAHMKNFMLLDPVNKKNVAIKPQSIKRTIDVDRDMAAYIDAGFCKSIEFVNTSKQNNLVCQLFEQHDGRMVKLDVIDYGVVATKSNVHPTQHIFFVGKIFVDDNDSHTFVHMFTVVFD